MTKKKNNALALIQGMIDQAKAQAQTAEALAKLEEVVVAPNGYDTDELTVMLYTDPVEGEDLESGEYVYDETLEDLARNLKRLGIKTLSERNLVLDPNTGKLR